MRHTTRAGQCNRGLPPVAVEIAAVAGYAARAVAFVAAAALAAGALLAAPATAQPTPDHADLPYAFQHVRQKLDLYLPDGVAPPYPVIVWIHGGGWQAGDKSSAAPRAAQLLPHGFAVAGVNYRLSGQEIFPAQIHDCKGAVRWLRANATTYGLDPTRIGVWGSSAGGHLVALLGTSGDVAAAEGDVGGNLAFSSRVHAVADYFGPTDLLNINLDVTTPPGSSIDHDAPTSPESHLIGFDDPGQGIGVLRANQNNPAPPFPEKMMLVTLANPVTHVTADDPAFYIAHGTMDTTVPLAQSTRLATALAAAGVTRTYNQVAGAGHGMPPSVDALVVTFFRARLGAPATGVPAVSAWMVGLTAVVVFGIALRAASACARPRATLDRVHPVDKNSVQNEL